MKYYMIAKIVKYVLLRSTFFYLENMFNHIITLYMMSNSNFILFLFQPFNKSIIVSLVHGIFNIYHEYDDVRMHVTQLHIFCFQM